MQTVEPLRLLNVETLTDDERRGFLFACEVMGTWARQIRDNAPKMVGPDEPIPLRLSVENSCKFAQGLADAMATRARS